MLSTLPMHPNTAAPSHADPTGTAGAATREGVDTGQGFATVMRQQTDLRLADQRVSAQRLSDRHHRAQQAARATAGDAATRHLRGAESRGRVAGTDKPEPGMPATANRAAALRQAGKTNTAELQAAAVGEPAAAGGTAGQPATPDASALQPWLQTQARVVAWPPVPATAGEGSAVNPGPGTDASARATETLADGCSRGPVLSATDGPTRPAAAGAQAPSIAASQVDAGPAQAATRRPAGAGPTVGAESRGTAAAIDETVAPAAGATAPKAPTRTPTAQAASALAGLARQAGTETSTRDELAAGMAASAQPAAAGTTTDAASAAMGAAVAASAVANPPAPVADVLPTAGAATATAAGHGARRAGEVDAAARSGPSGRAAPDRIDLAPRRPGPFEALAAARSANAASPRALAGDGAPGPADPTAIPAAATWAAEPAGEPPPAAAGVRDRAPNDITRPDTLRSAEADPTPPTALAAAVPGNIVAASTPLPAAVGPLHEARIPEPLDSPAFGPALGTQISLFARDGVQTARLQLNPAEMGPISVQIALDGHAARVDFQADRAATREVIEASLPALAGALQDAGLTLAGGGVFQQAPGRQGHDGASASAPAPRGADRHQIGVPADPAPEHLVVRSRGLVDLVA